MHRGHLFRLSCADGDHVYTHPESLLLVVLLTSTLRQFSCFQRAHLDVYAIGVIKLGTYHVIPEYEARMAKVERVISPPTSTLRKFLSC